MTTNDPKNELIKLKVTGNVQKFVTIKPSRVILKGIVGEEISKKVTIIPETPVPFNIVNVSQMHSKNFRHTLKEIENSGKKAYELTIENMLKDAGVYHDKIMIITDRSDHMPLTIKVDGRINAFQLIEEKPAPALKPEPADHPELAPGIKLKPADHPEPAPESTPESEPGKTSS